MMKIACIHASIHNLTSKGKFKYYVEDLLIDREEVDDEGNIRYVLQKEEDGEPRGNYIYKEINEDAFSMGYISLNLPCWIKCETWEASGMIYVLEDEVENGKHLLQQAILELIDSYIKRYETLKHLIRKE